MDIREWLNDSVREEWADKGLEWIEPSPLTIAKEQKVDLEPFCDLPICENLTISQAHRRLGLALLEAWTDEKGKARLKKEFEEQNQKDLEMQTIPESVVASSSRPTTPCAMDEDLPCCYKEEAIESHRRILRDSIIIIKDVIAKLEKSLKKKLWREVQACNSQFSERDREKRIDIPE